MSKLERAPLPPSSAGKISIIQNEHLSFFSRGATLFVSLTVVWCHSLPHPPLVKALYITSYLAALFPGFMQCADISIFLGLSAPRMILIRLTYKKDSLSAEKTVIWAHLCVTGVILALSVNVLYTSTLFHLRIRLNKTVSCLYFLFFFGVPNMQNVTVAPFFQTGTWGFQLITGIFRSVTEIFHVPTQRKTNIPSCVYHSTRCHTWKPSLSEKNNSIFISSGFICSSSSSSRSTARCLLSCNVPTTVSGNERV